FPVAAVARAVPPRPHHPAPSGSEVTSMSSPPSSLDLIQRAAEKLRAAEQNSTIERAAQKLRDQAPATPPPATPIAAETHRQPDVGAGAGAAPGSTATDSQSWSGRS